jgi:hypothetical protein
MRRHSIAFSVLTLIGLGVTGCGLYKFEQREAWRTQAEEACLSQKLVTQTAYMSRTSAIDGPGACGMSYPFKVAAFADGSVGLSRAVTLACPIIPSIDTWLNDIVQPAASLYFGTSVIEVRSGTYSCRPRNNQRGAKLSEHAYGNAVDVMAFRFADGRELTVLKGWRGAPEEQDFLREVFVGACSYFTTVLGPGADAFHHDHFHLDLARHDARGERRICKPILKFSPRLDGYAGGETGRPRPAETSRSSPEPLPEIEMEEDDDPFAVSSGPSPRQTYASARPSGSPQLPTTTPSAQAPLRTVPQDGRNLAQTAAPPRTVVSAQPLPPPSGYSYGTAPPVPPARVPRGSEPVPPYEPPARREPMVLQPQLRNGGPLY